MNNTIPISGNKTSANILQNQPLTNASDIILLRTDNRPWREAVRQIDGDGAVQTLVALLDYAIDTKDRDLKEACEARLASLSCATNDMGFEAGLVRYKDASHIVEAYFRSEEDSVKQGGVERPVGAKALWKRCMDWLVSMEVDHAETTLTQIQDCAGDSELGRAAASCLKTIRSREEKRQFYAMPLKDDTVTYGDGECFQHAAQGAKSANGFRCTQEQVDDCRYALKLLLENPAPHLKENVDAGLAAFHHDLLAFVFLPKDCKDELPNLRLIKRSVEKVKNHLKPDTEFHSLDSAAQKAIRSEFILCFGTRGFYIPCSMAGVVAAALKQPISLYALEHDVRHYDGDGRTLKEPDEHSVSIRFDPRRHHFERVDPRQARPLARGAEHSRPPEIYVSLRTQFLLKGMSHKALPALNR
jgi:hypothetical protein